MDLSRVRLIASDMDGTLLNDAGEVPEETFELIRRLADKGIRFVASSGRRLSTLQWMFEPVADMIDYVAALGCEVMVDGQLLSRETFSTLAVHKLFETCARYDKLHLVLYDETRTFLLDDQSSYLRELDKDLRNALQIYDPPTGKISITKAACCCDDPDLLMDMAYVLERELSDWFMFLPSGSRWIDVSPRMISKATGIEQVLRYYGINKDDVIAFGDSMNDYAMLRYVGHPFVMNNARYPLKQIAQRVISSNTEHGVQMVMRELLGDSDS